MDVVNSIIISIETFWSFLDSWTILRTAPLLGEFSFLDFVFGSYVIGLSLWFVFGFNGGDE